MTRETAPPADAPADVPRRGGLGRLLVRTLLALALLLAVVVGAVLALTEPGPRVERLPEATPDVARNTRDVVKRVRALDEITSRAPVLGLTAEELQAMADFAARLVPGSRGAVDVFEGGVEVRGSVPIPYLPGGRWLNARAVIPAFEGRATFAAVQLGPLDLPPAFATALLESTANLVLGGGMGTRVRDAVPRIEVRPPEVAVTVISDPAMRGAFTRRTFGALRSGEMPGGERMRVHYLALRRAIDAGRLPDEGSFLPYLAWVLESAAEHAEPGREDFEFTAAIFALARACGAAKFSLVVGRLIDGVVVPEDEPDWQRSCGRTTLRGRVDKRRHFVTAAAIKAASTMRVSFAIGEFKELVDSLGERGVFDFTDIAANASGIRFAQTVMATPAGRWPRLETRMRTEDDVLASFEGVPGETQWDAFEDRFGRVDSPAYDRMVAKIERRIDALPFHAGQPPREGVSPAGGESLSD